MNSQFHPLPFNAPNQKELDKLTTEILSAMCPADNNYFPHSDRLGQVNSAEEDIVIKNTLCTLNTYREEGEGEDEEEEQE